MKKNQLVEAVNAYAKHRGYQLTPFGEQVVRAEIEIIRPDARAEMERLIQVAQDWRREEPHGMAQPSPALAAAKAPADLPTGKETSRGGRRVLGAKDSKDGGAA